MKAHLNPTVTIRQVTQGPHAHYFGYYDKTPWDASGRYLLAMQTPLTTQIPGPDDTITLGLIDTQENDAWQPLTMTQAWNWQMGCRLQWLGSAPDRLIIYNVRRGDHFGAEIRDVFTGETRQLDWPIYDVTPDGQTAYSLNFARLATYRPGYGYAGVPDPQKNHPHPEDDGIWRINLQTGTAELLVSYADIAAFQPAPSMEGMPHWFNHIMISPGGQRLFFLHRWRWMDGDIPAWQTRLITINPDGSEPFVLPDLERVSHYDWRDDSHILLAAHLPGSDHYTHNLLTDRSTKRRVLAPDLLQENGHCSYSPDRRWILTDTYPDENGYSKLLLLHLYDEHVTELASLWSPSQYTGEVRCDLHPRWSRAGRQICIDTTASGTRQMAVVSLDLA